jgi:hypothetical protein
MKQFFEQFEKKGYLTPVKIDLIVQYGAFRGYVAPVDMSERLPYMTSRLPSFSL